MALMDYIDSELGVAPIGNQKASGGLTAYIDAELAKPLETSNVTKSETSFSVKALKGLGNFAVGATHGVTDAAGSVVVNAGKAVNALTPFPSRSTKPIGNFMIDIGEILREDAPSGVADTKGLAYKAGKVVGGIGTNIAATAAAPMTLGGQALAQGTYSALTSDAKNAGNLLDDTVIGAASGALGYGAGKLFMKGKEAALKAKANEKTSTYSELANKPENLDTAAELTARVDDALSQQQAALNLAKGDVTNEAVIATSKVHATELQRATNFQNELMQQAADARAAKLMQKGVSNVDVAALLGGTAIGQLPLVAAGLSLHKLGKFVANRADTSNSWLNNVLTQSNVQKAAANAGRGGFDFVRGEYNRRNQ